LAAFHRGEFVTRPGFAIWLVLLTLMDRDARSAAEEAQTPPLLVPALENGRGACAICDKRQYLLRIALGELADRIEVVDNTRLVTRHAGAK
jgi:hypothetical protein